MRRRHLELGLGLGLLLGPLVYALTLEPSAAPECATALAEPAPAVVEVCEQPEMILVEVVPEPDIIEVAPEPTPPLEPMTPERELASFLFVTDAGVVLSTEAEQAWGKGKLFEPKGHVSYRAAKRAEPTAIPSALWSMRGRSFDLYNHEGKLCTARLGELRVLAQYDGWGLGGVLGDEWYDEDPERASKAEIREGLWQREDLWLVAEIESPDSCEGALWARDAELPPPKLLRRSTDPNSVSEARLAAFSRSEELAETERGYRAEYAALDPETREYYPGWDELVAQQGASAWSWLDEHGRPQLVGLEFGAESEGCGDPLHSRITALDHVRGDEFVPVAHGHWPIAVFDADLDGQLELLYADIDGQRLASATLQAYALVEEDWYCPC
ncbi:MAG: hypothetical protein R6X02_21405 [Enhygromyxa sp.]